MMISAMKWFCHRCYNVMTKAIRIEVNTVHVVLVFAEVDFVIEDVPRRRVGTHSNFYAILSWLSGHVLPEGKTAFESNHPFIYGKVFARIVRILESFLTML